MYFDILINNKECITPETLISSPASKKCWADWPSSVSELLIWDEEVKQIKSDMAG